MELVLVVVICVVGFFWYQGKKSISSQKLRDDQEGRLNNCLKLGYADFPVWLSIYIKCRRDSVDKTTLASTFVQQSFTLASAMGALNHPDAKEVSENLHNLQSEECIQIADSWIENALPTLNDVCGEQFLDASQARLVGALMIVTLTSMIPHQGLQDFLKTKGVPKELTRVAGVGRNY